MCGRGTELEILGVLRSLKKADHLWIRKEMEVTVKKAA